MVLPAWIWCHGPACEKFLLRYSVNDRPYMASSLPSAAISRVFGSALSGKCERRRGVVERALPFTARLGALPCRGGETILRRLLEPLGYLATSQRHSLDERRYLRDRPGLTRVALGWLVGEESPDVAEAEAVFGRGA